MVKFIVVGPENPTKTITRSLGTFLTFAGLIGLGWALGSSAMQWAGMLIGWAFLLAVAVGGLSRKTLTPDEAHREIDRIAREVKS